MAMPNQYLAFDIETIGLPMDTFDASQQQYLLRNANTDEEQQKKIDEFALSPLTGSVVCIGMIEYTQSDQQSWSSREVAYSAVPSQHTDGHRMEHTLPSGALCFQSSEHTMLENFWRYIASNKNIHLVSFNGRGFDAPWLMLRSAVLGIKPSRNLMEGTRFSYPNHTDLLDKLTFYTPQAQGATRRFNFDFYAKAFGITSPKADGVDGTKVHALYDQGDHDEIAEYCLRDVRATWQLFQRWSSLLGS
jgi:3'-5' exonuclease